MDLPFLGMLQYYGCNFAPRYYTMCSGQLLSIASNTPLFSLLGTTFGGNGISTFGLPDMRGRTNYGQGSSYTMGQRSGAESASLLTSNMPSHTHTVTTMQIAANSSPGDTTDPTGAYPASPDNRGSIYGSAASGRALGQHTATVGTAGLGLPFNRLNPYLALTCCITLQGIYPARN